MIRATPCLALGLLLAAPCAAWAQPPAKAFTFEPIVIDSKDSTGATVGARFEFSGTPWEIDIASGDRSFSEGVLTIEGKGVVAADPKRNPENFLDAKLRFSYLHFQGATDTDTLDGNTTLIAGAMAKFETDQSFENEQAVFGGSVTYTNVGVFKPEDFFAIHVSYGQVDPGDDKERKTALGVSKLESYDRTEVEVEYVFPTGWTGIEAIELNYRRFDELDAPVAISAAGLDHHELSTIRLKLPGVFFVAYSTGKLPFDRKSDQIFKIGLTQNLF